MTARGNPFHWQVLLMTANNGDFVPSYSEVAIKRNNFQYRGKLTFVRTAKLEMNSKIVNQMPKNDEK